jgi:dipeptidyl-peptidase-4
LLTSLASAQHEPPATSGQELTVEKIFTGPGLTGREPETVRWSPDGKKVSYILREESGATGQLWYIDVSTGKPAVLVTQDRLASLAPPDYQVKNERELERRMRYGVAAYHWAPDSKHLLFDSHGQLWFYSLDTNTAVPLTGENVPAIDPKFSDDGSHVAYVFKHNLYVRSVAGDTEYQLTQDKDPNLLDGEVDWVYAEELDVRSNYFWSPNGKRIVFLQMNETPVPTYPIEDFIPTHPNIDFQKYPKAGDPNPAVRLGVVASSGGKIRWIDVPKQKPSNHEDTLSGGIGGALDFYIARIGWVRDGVIYFEVLNRDQNQLNLYFADVDSAHSRLILSDTSDNWIDVNDDLRVLGSGEKFIWASWRDGFTHLYLYDVNSPSAPATLERQLTQGNYEVHDLVAVNEAAHAVYFTANKDDDRQSQLYSVQLDGSGLKRISREEGTHAPEFAKDASLYVDLFSAQMIPPRMSLCSLDGSCQVFWQSRSLSDYNLIAPKFVDFQAEDGTTLHGSLLLPPHIEGKAPLLMNPYGGPHAQRVRNAWGGNDFLFDQILAREGIAVLRVDNRGMGNRGQKFATALRHNFGEVELNDQLTALDQALAQFPQLDGSRLGWWGWSYGGYMTLFALTHSDRFRAGVAVAPVTDWRDYDSIYTERYMGLPQQDEAAYKKSSPVFAAAHLHGNLLIAHGTGDDNVHMQNTIQMALALINNGKPFDMALYPRKTHSISGSENRRHLFNKIKAHFERYLLGTATHPAGAQ